MATLEIDIYSAGKASKLGYGPVSKVIGFSANDRTNEAGRWSFTVPAEIDTSNIINGNEAYGYALEEGNRLCVFGGQITDVSPLEKGDGGLDLEVSGFGLLDKLTDDWIVSEELKESGAGVRPLRVYDLNLEADLVNSYDGNAATGDTWSLDTVGNLRVYYICYTQPFWDVVLNIGTPNTTSSTTLTAQYYSPVGFDDVSPGWKEIGITDGTKSGTTSMAQDGTIAYTRPTDWLELVLYGYQGYWLRIYANKNFSAQVLDMTISTHVEKAADISTIVGLSSDMTIQSGGGYYSGTNDGTYLKIQNSNVLSALRQVAEAENGIFRVEGRDQYKVAYLRDNGHTPTDTLYAVGPSAPGDYTGLVESTMIITGFDYQKNSDNQANRIYIRGSGNGTRAKAGLEFADSSWLPSGYDANLSDGYVQKTTVTTRKSAGLTLPGMKNIDGARETRELANQLLRTAYYELIAREEPVEFLQLEVGNVTRAILPGDNITVIYNRASQVTNTQMININGSYTVMSVSPKLIGGVFLLDLTLSNVTRQPKQELDFALDTAEKMKRMIETAQAVRAGDIFGQPVEVI